jgi:hypothetical protein
MILKDSAIQIILIMDYILDWARNVYRPSILRHLKSISTGRAYDDIILTNDNDIFSMRRKISNWIPAPPSTADACEPSALDGTPEQSELLQTPIPNINLGLVRSAALFEFRFVGLHIQKVT